MTSDRAPTSMAPARDVVTATRWPGPNCQYRVRHSAPEFTEQGENTNQRMNDEKNTTTSANEKQTRVEEDLRAEPGELANQRVENNAERDRGIMLVDRPPKPGTIELKGPPGLAVSVGGDEWCTKIVLHLPVRE